MNPPSREAMKGSYGFTRILLSDLSVNRICCLNQLCVSVSLRETLFAFICRKKAAISAYAGLIEVVRGRLIGYGCRPKAKYGTS